MSFISVDGLAIKLCHAGRHCPEHKCVHVLAFLHCCWEPAPPHAAEWRDAPLPGRADTVTMFVITTPLILPNPSVHGGSGVSPNLRWEIGAHKCKWFVKDNDRVKMKMQSSWLLRWCQNHQSIILSPFARKNLLLHIWRGRFSKAETIGNFRTTQLWGSLVPRHEAALSFPNKSSSVLKIWPFT